MPSLLSADSPPTASRVCAFGVVEVIRCGTLWHWRCAALRYPAWSKATFTSAMDAYQGAAFAAAGRD